MSNSDHYALKSGQEVPHARDLADSIVKTVCEFYEVSRERLYVSRRGQYNDPKNVAIFLTQKLRYDSLKEIGRQFGLEKYSSVSGMGLPISEYNIVVANFEPA